MQLDEAAAIGLAGPDVADLDAAAATEAVTADDVQAAEQAAQAAEAKAGESEHAALAGKLNPAQAAADREAAKYSALRLAVTRRRHERHQQAERIKGLHEVGQAALGHAAALQQLKGDTLADVARIQELQDGIRARFRKANEELIAIAARGAALGRIRCAPGG